MQEVTQRAATQIRGSKPLCDMYHISDNDVGSYGVLMLVKRHATDGCVLTENPVFKEHAMPTKYAQGERVCV